MYIVYHTTKPMTPRTLHNNFTRRTIMVQRLQAAAYAFYRYEKYNNQTANALLVYYTIVYYTRPLSTTVLR